jgi:transcriptional regulator with GAF, ATPase, and Fis domain
VDVRPEPTVPDVKSLQRCINDLVSILALPAMWVGDEPSRIVDNFLGALMGMLQLDLAYMRLRDRVGEAPMEMVRVARSGRVMPPAQEIGAALDDGWHNCPQQQCRRVRNPVGDGDVSIIAVPLGVQGEIGVIVAGSERADFPVQTERLLLGVAANQAAIVLQEARLLSEQQRIAKELDQRVGERTEELAAANDELRTALEENKRLKDQLHKENIALREEIDQASMFEEIIGSSDPLRKLLAQVGKVAASESAVLILGETGTGKELIARAIHKRSRRAARAFIAVNCGAIPESLVASTLFGHEKGAFTGATQRRLGRFEAANGGTLFLDEVGDLPTDVQVALLRVLQEREIERVGGDKPIPVDVRVLAATHRDLEKLVTQGRFREDLLYRLNVVPIEVPSLRERAGDIPMLVEYFIARFGKRAGKKFKAIDTKAAKILQAYDWPGNVRELQNVIERAVILCESSTFTVDETWLKRQSGVSRGATALGAVLQTQEREMIEAALAGSRGRVSGPGGAAAKLAIPTRTLDSKIKRLGIDKYRFKSPTS